MAFGIYIHIPHCLQVCPYCDFTKYEWNKILPLDQYVDVVRREIRQRAQDIGERVVDTVYFGGGTPSLLETKLILALLDELAISGFSLAPDAEMTVEINPGTVNTDKLKAYRDAGMNRFSVGAQTFNERLLKLAGRKHSPQDSVTTLRMLAEAGVNFSFDLLFALPTQSLAELDLDLAQAISFDPAHLSAYYLTVPENHPMAQNRAPDEEQVEMFDLIERRLLSAGLPQYEISSYAKPNRQSRHNHLYWADQEYWGLGVSAHSYSKRSPWGMRYWNPSTIGAYVDQITKPTLHPQVPPEKGLPWLDQGQFEQLERHQALTDFCHVSLRRSIGLDVNALRLRFGDQISSLVVEHLESLMKETLVESGLHEHHERWRLTRQGRRLANIVFARLTFLKDDLGTR